jgi:arylsulfatase A-like enzyme
LNRRIQAAVRQSHLTAAAYDELYFWYCQWRSSRENLSVDKLRGYPPADVIVDQACTWLGSLGDQPFLLWIHLMDPHHPHYPPPEALSALGLSHTTHRAQLLNSFWNRREIGPKRLQRYRDQVLSLYDAGVYWVDKQISRLVDSLRQRQRWDETAFVLTADHGEEFLEHGVRYHSPLNLPEELIHVPLLLRAPGLSGTHIFHAPFSLIHLAPTLLEIVGARVPESFQGRGFWEQIFSGTWEGEPAIAEAVGTGDNPLQLEGRMQPRVMAVRDSRYKLVIHLKENKETLYDLKSDPEERSPLPLNAVVSERARLLQLAHAHLQKSRESRNVELALSARLREIRHSLG